MVNDNQDFNGFTEQPLFGTNGGFTCYAGAPRCQTTPEANQSLVEEEIETNHHHRFGQGTVNVMKVTALAEKIPYAAWKSATSFPTLNLEGK